MHRTRRLGIRGYTKAAMDSLLRGIDGSSRLQDSIWWDWSNRIVADSRQVCRQFVRSNCIQPTSNLTHIDLPRPVRMSVMRVEEETALCCTNCTIDKIAALIGVVVSQRN